MGDVVEFPRKNDAEAELDRLLARLEEGGALACLLQNSAGDMTLAFEPWPAAITEDGLAAINDLMNRFRESRAIREAMVAYSWNVGASYIEGHVREVRSN